MRPPASEPSDRAAVRTEQGEPAWAVGGSRQVVRIIQLATDFRDRDTVAEQERIIGRRRDGRRPDNTPRRTARLCVRPARQDNSARRACPQSRT
ncbi:hypothetical protein AB0O01_00365 [Streptomyces sp. NPDC093252]|uniref:hypothetical protein n=1 Tax=Streptomyces sp. NPDC093252 TaxID=3154980 RepID=UPI00343AB126